MAARETQGLTITLILFVMLTIVLIVTTFMFFSKYKEEVAKSGSLTKQLADEKTASNNAQTASRNLKLLLGAGDNEEPEKVIDAGRKEIEQSGKNLPDGENNFRGLVKFLNSELNSAHARLVKATASEKEMSDKMKANEDAKKAEIANYDKTMTSTTTDLKSVRDQFAQDVAGIDEGKQEISNSFASRRRELEEREKKASDRVVGLNTEVGKLQGDVKTLREIIKDDVEHATIPDGKIMMVDQRQKLVWINRGSEDGLRPQISFSVFSPDDANPTADRAKGKIEIVKVTGAHTAEARIVEDNFTLPLLKGDFVFNPTWEPGTREHFALAGFMDIDGDNVSDRQRIRDLISLNGGLVDAELGDDGKPAGKMSFETRYLVVGAKMAAANTAEDGAIKNAYDAMQVEANKIGVQILPLKAFLDLMGYKIEDRTVQMSENVNRADFNARFPNGVQPVVPQSRQITDPPTRNMPITGVRTN